MGETYQVWRDEYPEDILVHRRASPKEEPPSQQHTAVIIPLKDGGGHKLYCKGAAGYVLPRCTQMALPSLDDNPFGDNDKDVISKDIENLQKTKQFEVLCLALKYFPTSETYGKLVCTLRQPSYMETKPFPSKVKRGPIWYFEC